jgi:hypothetical protein
LCGRSNLIHRLSSEILWLKNGSVPAISAEVPGFFFVMAGPSRPNDGVASARLCPAIHVFARDEFVKTWMPGTRPAQGRA